VSVAESPNRALEVRREKFNAIRTALNQAKGNLEMALPRHMTADRMLRIALSACSRQPKLLDCTPASIALALINASEVGLEPNGREAHLIPYRNNDNNTMEAQFQPDYKGLVQLAYRSGSVRSFHAAAVYERDFFEYKYGSQAFVSHKPCDEELAGALKYAYAIAELKEGGEKFVVLNRRQVMKRKASSKTRSQNTPWQTHEEAMWAKSAAKELCKWIPASSEMQRALQLDDESEGAGTTIDLDLPEAPPQPSSLDALADRLTEPLAKETPPDSPQQEGGAEVPAAEQEALAHAVADFAACGSREDVAYTVDVHSRGASPALSRRIGKLAVARELEIAGETAAPQRKSSGAKQGKLMDTEPNIGQ